MPHDSTHDGQSAFGRRKNTTILALLALLIINVGVRVPESAANLMNVFDQLDLLVDVRQQLVANYVEEVDQGVLVERAVEAMVESLDDPFTEYYSQDQLAQFQKHVRGAFSGIGAEITSENDHIKIVTPLEDSPAWRAGIVAGDVILKIDGEDAAGITVQEAVDRLTGPEGTDVTITIRHETGSEETVTITRARIRPATVKGIRRDAEQHWDYMIDPGSKVAYIRLTNFVRPTAEELEKVLESLEADGARGLILDLRFNPGGLLESAVKIADLFLDEGQTVVSIRGRMVEEKSHSATSHTPFDDIPMVVLANEASASASEILAGALLDHGRAVVVGTRTFGKGSVQQIFALPRSPGAVKITNAHYYLPSGRNIHRRPDSDTWGVDPGDGFYVPMSAAELREMFEVRRNREIIRAASGDGQAGDPDEVTPEWVAETLKDPQLAAGLRAIQGKLETGKWPRVGESGVEALVRLQQIEELSRRRDLLAERLAEINEELTRLREGEDPVATAGGEADEPVEGVDESGPAAVDGPLPEPDVEGAIRGEVLPKADDAAEPAASDEAPAESVPEPAAP